MCGLRTVRWFPIVSVAYVSLRSVNLCEVPSETRATYNYILVIAIRIDHEALMYLTQYRTLAKNSQAGGT